MKAKNHVKLFSNCILVKGYVRGLICDLQREKSHVIPIHLCELTERLEKHTEIEVRSLYDEESQTIIDEYIKFLFDKELAFYCSSDELDLFPPLSIEWDYPSIITNAILDVNLDSNFDFTDIFEQLEGLGCRHLQIRIYETRTISELISLIACSEGRSLKSIQLFVGMDSRHTESDYLALIKEYPRITGLYLHSAGEDKLLTPESTPMIVVAKLQDPINFSQSCGIVDPSFFVTTLELFTESINHNSCINRKVSIDVKGNIKNCPSMLKHYGNISSIRISDAIMSSEFQNQWNITKNQIKVCQDCEFRHICTDCRAFTEDPNDLFSKPLKCGYNPYTAKWEDWTRIPEKFSAIEFYNFHAELNSSNIS